MAKLKALVKDLKEVDEKFHEMYTKTDDGYILDVDGAEYKSKLEEFRSNNKELYKAKQKLEEQMEKFKDVDPAKYKKAQAALEKLEKLEEKELVEAGDVDKLVERRVETMRNEFQTLTKQMKDSLAAAETERSTLKSRLSELLIDTDVQKTISALGSVKKGAMDDVLARARRSWQVSEEGKLVAKNARGEQLFDGKGDPLTMEAWAKQLFTEAPFLFEPSSGGGSGGGKKNNGVDDNVGLVPNNAIDIGRNLEDIASGKKVVAGTVS